MKVKQLIEILQRCPQDYDVNTEGCDCIGDVENVAVFNADEQIIIMRPGDDNGATEMDAPDEFLTANYEPH